MNVCKVRRKGMYGMNHVRKRAKAKRAKGETGVYIYRQSWAAELSRTLVTLDGVLGHERVTMFV